MTCLLFMYNVQVSKIERFLLFLFFKEFNFTLNGAQKNSFAPSPQKASRFPELPHLPKTLPGPAQTPHGDPKETEKSLTRISLYCRRNFFKTFVRKRAEAEGCRLGG